MCWDMLTTHKPQWPVDQVSGCAVARVLAFRNTEKLTAGPDKDGEGKDARCGTQSGHLLTKKKKYQVSLRQPLVTPAISLRIERTKHKGTVGFPRTQR